MFTRTLAVTAATCFALSYSLFSYATDSVPGGEAKSIQKLHLPKLAPDQKVGSEANLKVPNGSKIEEYKLNGRVYMIKVTPPKPFPPYYLEDKAGNGRFSEVPQNDAEHLSVPQWIIFRW